MVMDETWHKYKPPTLIHQIMWKTFFMVNTCKSHNFLYFVIYANKNTSLSRGIDLPLRINHQQG